MRTVKGIIYKITNLINGKIYIGQTIQELTARVHQHKYHARKEKPAFLISRAIKKYGPENFKFEAIDYTECPLDLNLKESHYISLYDSANKDKGYNVIELQDGVIIYSEERKKKQSEATKERFRKNNNSEVRGRKLRKKEYTNYVGAYRFNGKSWVAWICCDSKRTYLGSFTTEIDAAMAYDIAAVKLFGIEARLNFPNLLNDYINDKIHPIRKKRGDYAKIRKGLL